ncbi:putative MIZ/SP-RING zinc finger [Blattamonas nauphoetae]|uniref:MIZ/SP-RING zinc finger n=1 Tax=Blattamonas nauphoetae TaxID=2049346 RepID=A0ABQ9YFM2_9EUKA|nr:putative MIZ/SP-RING zinc finger [Blattamonas nauphoetae]
MLPTTAFPECDSVAQDDRFRQTLDPFYEVVEILNAFPLDSHITGIIDVSRYYQELMHSRFQSTITQPKIGMLRLHLRCFSLSALEIPLTWERHLRVNNVFVDCTLASNTDSRISKRTYGQGKLPVSSSVDITPYIFSPRLSVQANDMVNTLDGVFVPMVVRPRTIDQLIESLRNNSRELQLQCDKWEQEEAVRLARFYQLDSEKKACIAGQSTRSMADIDNDLEKLQVEMDKHPFPSTIRTALEPLPTPEITHKPPTDGFKGDDELDILVLPQKRRFDLSGEVSETVSSVRLNCPLMVTRMEIPTRSRRCTHLQCFDLKGFLQYSRRDKQYVCPVCHKAAPMGELVIDLNMERIMRTVGENVDQVVVMEDGRWEEVGKSWISTASSGPTLFGIRKARQEERMEKELESVQRAEEERMRRQERRKILSEEYKTEVQHDHERPSLSRPLTVERRDGQDFIILDDDED